VWATRFRQWRSEGVRPCKVICCKANRSDRETEEEPLIEHARGRSKLLEGRTPVSLSRPASQSSAPNLGCADHGERFDRQRSKKFFYVLNMQNRSRQMCCEKTGIRRNSNPRLRPDFALR